MQLRAGDIFITPKMVYWINMPRNIPQSFHIELLRKDILLIECNLEDMEKLNDLGDKEFLVFFNLDPIMRPYREAGDNTDLKQVLQVINLLKVKFHGKNIIHTSVINSKLNDICKKNRIPYIENNLSNWTMVPAAT